MNKERPTENRLSWLRGDAPCLLALAVIAVLAHRPWFDPRTILTSGDWQYWPDEAVRQLHYAWITWLHLYNFGDANPQLPFYGFKVIWSLLVNLGLHYDQATKLTFFIPISFLLFVSPYVLARRLTGDPLIAFVVALFYGTTTYGVVNQVPIQFVYALAPLTLYLLIRAFEEPTVSRWLVFALVYTVGIIYEVRIMYAVTLVLAIYALLAAPWSRRTVKPMLTGAAAVLGLNLFWFLPTFFTGVAASVSDLVSRGLFGSFLFDLPHAFNIFTWTWTGGHIGEDFTLHPVIWYFWLYPLAAFAALLVAAKAERRRVAAFAAIALVGIFLGKQESEPFPGVYSWLYGHLPGFNLFREASKLYIVIAVGYAGLIGFTLLALKRGAGTRLRRVLFFGLAAALTAASLWTLKPLFTLEIGGLFEAKSVPHDLAVAHDLINAQPGMSRTLWLPSAPVWAAFSDEHPRAGLRSLLSGPWKRYVLTQPDGTPLPPDAQILGFVSRPDLQELLDAGSFEFIFVLPTGPPGGYYSFGTDLGRSAIVNALDASGQLERVDLGTNGMLAYRNRGYRPPVYLSAASDVLAPDQAITAVDPAFIDPAHYQVHLRGVRGIAYLHFTESSDPDWKLRVGPFSWLAAIFRKDYFLPNTIRSQDAAGLNTFLLDPRTVCAAGQCRMNPDGSYDADVTLFFRPQAFMLFGGAVSILTLLACLAYLIIRRRPKRALAGASEI